MFERIKNDEYIKDIYNKITLLEKNGSMWHSHSFKHIDNVINTVESILKQLNYSDDLIEIAKIAAVLHDIGCINGKDEHAERSFEMAKMYFKDNGIITYDNNLILEAIKSHSDIKHDSSFITKVLVFADKLDLKSDRLTEAGKNTDIVKEFQYLEDIIVTINDKDLIVNFIANKQINKKVLESYYFIPKVFRAIKSFADELNINSTILFNNNTWEIDL
ncbi:MAG: HD domain-containing protein [Clostridia bacterium]|nr:HD domain-containing protein [Clostridia bacterium]